MTTQGQILHGTFKSGNEYLRFSNDTAFFRFLYGGGIYSEYKGSGKYHIENNRLIIEPIVENPREKIIKTNRENKESFFINVIMPDTSVNSVSLIVYDKKQKVILGQIIESGKKSFYQDT